LDAQKDDDDISLSPTRMFALPTISSNSAVFVCGSYPGFILKTAHSTAQFHKLVGESVRSVCQFNVMNGVVDGFLYYDSTVGSYQMPTEIRVLYESVNFLRTLYMMGNGLYDEYREERI
jgi:hypothetical protein